MTILKATMSNLATCALCLVKKPLMESHIIPAALYRLVQKGPTPDSVHQDPVVVSNGAAIQTSRQFKVKLLCESCEELLNKKGETQVIAQCFRQRGVFELRKQLERESPSLHNADSKWYSGSALGLVDPEVYRYFAMSVFFKSSVTERSAVGPNEYCHALGKKYEETLRRYLLDQEGFPKQAFLCVFVDSDTDPIAVPIAVISHPLCKREHGYRVHEFHIPGIQFSMFLGNDVKPSIRRLFGTWNTNAIFILDKLRDRQVFPKLVHMAKKTTPKGKLAKGSE